MLARDASHAITSANSFSVASLSAPFLISSPSSATSSMSQLYVPCIPRWESLLKYRLRIMSWNSRICKSSPFELLTALRSLSFIDWASPYPNYERCLSSGCCIGSNFLFFVFCVGFLAWGLVCLQVATPFDGIRPETTGKD
jgi:hypothetical protein